MLKWFVKTVPGFRTGESWKMVIALLGYILGLIFVLATPVAGTMNDKILDIVYYISLFGIPFILITNFGSIRNKLPLFKEDKFLYTVIGGCLSLIVTFALALVVNGATNNFHSEQYKLHAHIADEQLQTNKNTQANSEPDKIAAEKTLADARAIEEAPTKVLGSTEDEIKKIFIDYMIDEENMNTNAVKFDNQNLTIVVDFDSKGKAEGVSFLSNNFTKFNVLGDGKDSYVNKHYDELLELATGGKSVTVVKNPSSKYPTEIYIGNVHE